MKKETFATATVLAKRGLAAGCAQALRGASPLPAVDAVLGDAIKRVKGHATLRFTEAQVAAIRSSKPREFRLDGMGALPAEREGKGQP